MQDSGMRSIINKALFALFLLFSFQSSAYSYIKPDAFMDFGFDALSVASGYSDLGTVIRPDAVYRNPALLADIFTKTYSLNYVMPYKKFFDSTMYISGINYFSFAAAQNISKKMSAGIGVNYLQVLDIPNTDANGDTILGYFNDHMFGIVAGAGYSYNASLKFGASLKSIYEKLDGQYTNFSQKQFFMLPTLSVGGIYTLLNGITLSTKLDNLLPMKFGVAGIQPELKLGASYKNGSFEFLYMSDLTSTKIFHHFGLIAYISAMDFAVGYNTQNNGISMGINLNMNSVEFAYSIDFLNMSTYFSPTQYITLVVWY